VRYEVSNVTRVRACEDITDGRCERIEVAVRGVTDAPVLEMSAHHARALARALNRHANFIDPPTRRKKR
jgi:hypothetical protein